MRVNERERARTRAMSVRFYVLIVDGWILGSWIDRGFTEELRRE